MLHRLNLPHKRYTQCVCMLFVVVAKVKMHKFTHQRQTFSQTFIKQIYQHLLERGNLVYLTVINQILFGIVLHFKMMFWMCLILMLHQ